MNNNFTQEEIDLILRVRLLQPFEKIEIKLKDNKSSVIYTVTKNSRYEYEI